MSVNMQMRPRKGQRVGERDSVVVDKGLFRLTAQVIVVRVPAKVTTAGFIRRISAFVQVQAVSLLMPRKSYHNHAPVCFELQNMGEELMKSWDVSSRWDTGSFHVPDIMCVGMKT